LWFLQRFFFLRLFLPHLSRHRSFVAMPCCCAFSTRSGRSKRLEGWKSGCRTRLRPLHGDGRGREPSFIVQERRSPRFGNLSSRKNPTYFTLIIQTHVPDRTLLLIGERYE
jgi:hypothetical protein